MVWRCGAYGIIQFGPKTGYKPLWFILCFCQSFLLNFLMYQRACINESYNWPKILLICKIKKLEIQPYLCLPLPKNLVSYLTKLRISAHQLYVETSRYCRYCNPPIPRENRFCFHWKNILDCPLYKHVRKKVFKMTWY